jgi:uncharacterized damage-inducible protein DinB
VELHGAMREIRSSEPPLFPVGDFTPASEPDDRLRGAWIDELDGVPSRLRAAVAGLSDPELENTYRNWTIRQIVHHLADSNFNSYTRFKLALTEDRPTIKPYDEGQWSLLPDAMRADVELSLRMLDGVHGRWTYLLRSVGREAFVRSYYHPETHLTMPLWQALAYYAWHGRHHTAQIEWVKRYKLATRGGG